MSAEQQKGRSYEQLRLFPIREEEYDLGHGMTGEGGTGTSQHEERQAFTALDTGRALAEDLMERVCDRANLNQAYRRVRANKGSPGIDGMRVEDLDEWCRTHKDELIASLIDGSYQPQPVKGVQIPKPGGGARQLGIPTVVDRLVQQAILQVLEPMFDPMFSDSSFGFRTHRSAHDALIQASKYVEEGYNIVVDCDVEKFFDHTS